MREYRVIGPPGTGKTDYIKRNVAHAATAYGADKVVVCSLTRAAAAVAARAAGDSIPRENAGTIHSLCYRALKSPKIAEAEIGSFNQFCIAERQPVMQISDKAAEAARSADDDIVEPVNVGESAGDKSLSELMRLRSRMAPRQIWPEQIRAFDRLWSAWKRAADLLDFTDLLEVARRDVAECPGSPAGIFVDEGQDCSRLAFSLIRTWGEKAITFIVCGDPDQSLYEWAGVDIRAFFEPALPGERTKVLEQSFRVPRAVHAYALRWIEATPGRAKIVYRPRDVEGEVRRDPRSNYYDARFAIDDAERQIERGKTCMFLTSCSYMLYGIVAALRDRGLPFHNPYRTRRGDWNPLRIGANSPAARLAAFVKQNSEYTKPPGVWTHRDVKRWADWLPTKPLFVRGARKAMDEAAEAAPDAPADLDTVLRYFVETDDPSIAWEPVTDGDLEWWLRSIDPKHADKLKYPMSVIARRGAAALTAPPQVVVSTIHAAKGAEADCVYLFPDLSPNGHTEWVSGGAGREGVRRAFYVGMTRARETLVLCNAATNMTVRL